MPTGLNPADIAAWMRERAHRFIEMAEEIEQTFKVNGHAQPPVGGKLGSTKDSMRRLLEDGKSRRPGQIAQHLGIPERTIRATIDEPNSGFACNERGWVTYGPKRTNEGGDLDG